MTREELKDIFQAPFSYANWSNLLTYLFAGAGKNCQLKPEAAPVAMDNVDDSEMDGYYLGEVSFGLQKLKLYAFHVKDATTNIKRNRVGLRNTVSYIKDYDDAAIVVYYNDTQWRVSYIRDIITAPKRYTYVFGESHNRYSTPISRFELLTKGDINFDTIYKAFEVEALGDDFFDEYKKRYKSLCDSKNLTTKNQRDYVKKMMGRLVFLQFLQKKGWMCSNYNYLQDLYVNSEYKDDFLEKVLEPLFFGVLNTKECDRNAEKLKVLGEKVDIPYLNGGLFEQDTEDSKYYRFDKSHFEGLFDFFSHYNFTIDENDPNDAEVGIDPEMLGHIFENLLDDNKDKGAFYTPKEIVQYMSRESLIQYLKTHTEERLHPAIVRLVNDGKVDDLLQNRDNANEINNYICSVKICDPAIGSGAFPMGLLNELFHCRQLLYGFTQTKGEFIPAQVKREIIQNNIFGVDIEQGAVDIARLRFWLALVVDETEKLPLPNLDYKIMCGNSLLSRYTMDMSLKEAFANYNSGKLPEDQLTGEKTRAFFAKNNPLYLLDLGANVFESATVDTNILILQNRPNEDKMFAAIIAEKCSDFSTVQFSHMPSNSSDNWIILSPIEQSIKHKIDQVGTPLKNWGLSINFGVKTGYNEVFVISSEKRDEILSQCESEAERERTIDIIKPIIRGKDVQCYQAAWADKWLIATYPAKKYDIELYPALKNYLLSMEYDRLEQSGRVLRIENGKEVKARKKTSNKWFEVQDTIAFWEELERDKIVWKRIGSILRFSYDTTGGAVLDSTCFATGKGVKFLAAVLNSKMGNYLFKDAPKTGTGDLLISVQAVNPVKVPQLTEEQQQPYIDRVNQILEKKSENPQADTSALEVEIDQMVYALYNLTPEEINLIENRQKT